MITVVTWPRSFHLEYYKILFEILEPWGMTADEEAAVWTLIKYLKKGD